MKLNEQFVLSIPDGSNEGMLYNRETGEYFRMNETTCFLLKHIQVDSSLDAADLTWLLCNEYEVNYYMAYQDNVNTINLLNELGVISKGTG